VSISRDYGAFPEQKTDIIRRLSLAHLLPQIDLAGAKRQIKEQTGGKLLTSPELPGPQPDHKKIRTENKWRALAFIQL
jgi:hypothetical protein